MVNFRIRSSVCCWEEGWRIQVGAQGYIEHCLGQIFEICKREFPTQWPHGNMEFATLLSPRESTVWLFYHAVFSRSAREFPTQWRLGNCEFLTLLSPPPPRIHCVALLPCRIFQICKRVPHSVLEGIGKF